MRIFKRKLKIQKKIMEGADFKVGRMFIATVTVRVYLEELSFQ